MRLVVAGCVHFASRVGRWAGSKETLAGSGFLAGGVRSKNGTSFTDGAARVRSMTPLGCAMRRTSHERNRMGRGGHAKEELENPKATLFLYWPASRCAQSTRIFVFVFFDLFLLIKGWGAGSPIQVCKI